MWTFVCVCCIDCDIIYTHVISCGCLSDVSMSEMYMWKSVGERSPSFEDETCMPKKKKKLYSDHHLVGFLKKQYYQ